MENTKLNILLIGMPMSGKTTVGHALSKKININYNDMDELIENKYNLTIGQIINTKGKDIFRCYEKECLQDFSYKKNHILATGGGAINKHTLNIALLFKYRIWLQASTELLLQRYEHNENKRPLLYNTNNLQETLINLFDIRKDYYRECSNIVINTKNKTIDQITVESINKINELN